MGKLALVLLLAACGECPRVSQQRYGWRCYPEELGLTVCADGRLLTCGLDTQPIVPPATEHLPYWQDQLGEACQ